MLHISLFNYESHVDLVLLPLSCSNRRTHCGLIVRLTCIFPQLPDEWLFVRFPQESIHPSAVRFVRFNTAA